MTNYLDKDVKNYWYIDEKGVLSLVSQCNDYFEEEKTSIQSSSKARKSSLNLAIKALAAIFGSASVNTNIEQNISNGQQQAYRFTKKAEQHLDQIIEYLKKRGQLSVFNEVENFIDIAEENLPLFCIASISFYLDKEYYLEHDESYSSLLPNNNLSSQITELIKIEKFILFKADLDKCLLPSHKWQRVVLGASLEKWLSVRVDSNGAPSFGKTSHLALLLRESVSSPININLLGHVTKMGTSLYIKPYAIWDIG
jgi:hypothetical protein